MQFLDFISNYIIINEILKYMVATLLGVEKKIATGIADNI